MEEYIDLETETILCVNKRAPGWSRLEQKFQELLWRPSVLLTFILKSIFLS